MRLALVIAPSLLVAGCGGGAEPARPERSAAAGEVLGGDASDAMLPLDTARSTSPPDTSAPDATTTEGVAVGTARSPAPRASPSATPTASVEERRARLPRPQISGGPEPLPRNPDAEDAPTPPRP